MTTRITRPRQSGTREAPKFSGLRFAIYSRKSTDDARHEDHKSIARQVEQAKAYVEAKGPEKGR